MACSFVIFCWGVDLGSFGKTFVSRFWVRVGIGRAS